MDLIALDDAGGLVFVEVKARCSDRYGTPLEAVDRRKQRCLGVPPERFYVNTSAPTNQPGSTSCPCWPMGVVAFNRSRFTLPRSDSRGYAHSRVAARTVLP